MTSIYSEKNSSWCQRGREHDFERLAFARVIECFRPSSQKLEGERQWRAEGEASPCMEAGGLAWHRAREAGGRQSIQAQSQRAGHAQHNKQPEFHACLCPPPPSPLGVCIPGDQLQAQGPPIFYDGLQATCPGLQRETLCLLQTTVKTHPLGLDGGSCHPPKLFAPPSSWERWL